MPLKILILAAGYGTRLQRDIIADQNRGYAHLLNIPKALLPLGPNNYPLITHWLNIFRDVKIEISSLVHVVTNNRFYDKFLTWATQNGIPSTNVITDGTDTNETRIGAVGDIAFAVEHFGWTNEELLIIGGDTLFLKSFSFESVLRMFIENFQEASLVTTYCVSDDEMSNVGILALKDDEKQAKEGKVLLKIQYFLEKPSAQNTSSRYACPCFYFLRSKVVRLIRDFLEQSKDKGEALEERDATGKFIAWVINECHETFYGFRVEGRIDVGNLESYISARNYFSANY
ncbi:hypothetical protein G9A89_004697 [Geosiphon pyriformis]|nr:hypothetical protein G9A89_004697 [Geosiphon pyriformis]